MEGCQNRRTPINAGHLCLRQYYFVMKEKENVSGRQQTNRHRIRLPRTSALRLLIARSPEVVRNSFPPRTSTTINVTLTQ